MAKLDAGPHRAVHVCPRLALEIDFPSSDSKISQKLRSGRLSIMGARWLFLDSLAQTLNQNPLPVAKLDAGPHCAVLVCPCLALEIDFPSSDSNRPKIEGRGEMAIVLHAVCPACRSDTFCNVLPFCIRQNILTMNASIFTIH